MQSFAEVMEFIRPQQIGRYWFIGKSPEPQIRIFGGQVLAQALMAAYDTVEEQLIAHSLHGYFLRPGDPNEVIELEVDPIRDGRSFCTRRVVARQQGKAIFNAAISFQVSEDGVSHQQDVPDVASPERLLAEAEDPEEIRRRWPLLKVFQTDRVTTVSRKNSPQPPIQSTWYRGTGGLSRNIRDQQAGLALISDFSLLGTAHLPHSTPDIDKDFMNASLDHAIWFHAPIADPDDYFLYHCDSPWAGGARGFNRGSFWTRDGQLIASTAQEDLMRPKRAR